MKKKIWNLAVALILSSLIGWTIWITDSIYIARGEQKVIQKSMDEFCNDMKEIKENIKDLRNEIKENRNITDIERREIYRILLEIKKRVE